MIAFIGSLIVAVLTGLAILAYREPYGYLKLFKQLLRLFILPLGYVAAKLGMIFSNITSLKKHLDEVPDQPLSNLDFLIDRLEQSVVDVSVVMIVGLILFLYLCFLAYLPDLLRHDNANVD